MNSSDDEKYNQAKTILDELFRPSLGIEGNISIYSEMSAKYDEYMQALRFTGPVVAAKAIAELYPEGREQVRILDIAAGTGQVGEEMYKLGFRQMDALDPAAGMLDIARQKGIYTKFYQDCIGIKELDIEDDTYDAITVSGGMGENQIPCSALKEMIRIVKPGGFIVNVMRYEHLTICTDYVDRLEPMIESLQNDGLWELVSKTIFPDFIPGKEGITLVHRVL